MNQTENYLRARYNKTKWPYYSLSWTKYDIGPSFDADIKELSEKEMVTPVGGMNGWLIQLVNTEINWN